MFLGCVFLRALAHQSPAFKHTLADLVYLVTAGELADLHAVASALFDMDDRSPWSRTPAAPPATATATEPDAAVEGEFNAAAEAAPVAPARRGRVLVSVSYRQHVRPGSTAPGAAAGTSTSNVFLAPGPTARWDSEADIASARDWFGRVFPGVPFSAPSHADRGQHFGDDLDDVDDYGTGAGMGAGTAVTEAGTQGTEAGTAAGTAGTAAAPTAASDADTVPAPAPTSAPARTWDPAPVPISDAAPVPTSDAL